MLFPLILIEPFIHWSSLNPVEFLQSIFGKSRYVVLINPLDDQMI